MSHKTLTKLTFAHTHTCGHCLRPISRLNYGTQFYDPKGCVGDVVLGDSTLANGSVDGDGWTVYRLPLSPSSMDGLAWDDDVAGMTDGTDGPVFYQGEVVLTEAQVTDSYVNTTSWGKGYVWVNGNNLGK